jgi:hypothetical protein
LYRLKKEFSDLIADFNLTELHDLVVLLPYRWLRCFDHGKGYTLFVPRESLYDFISASCIQELHLLITQL